MLFIGWQAVPFAREIAECFRQNLQIGTVRVLMEYSSYAANEFKSNSSAPGRPCDMLILGIYIFASIIVVNREVPELSVVSLQRGHNLLGCAGVLRFDCCHLIG